MAQDIRPLETYILTGLQRRIREVLGLSCGYNSSMDPWMQPDGTRKANFPLSYLRFNTITDRSAEDNSLRGVNKQWFYGGSTTDGNAVRGYRLLSVEFDIDFHYVTNNYDDMLRVINAWMFAWRANSLNFAIEYDGYQIDIKVQMAAEAQVPYQEAGLDEPIHYEYQNGIKVWGYLSQMVEVPKDVAKTISLSVYLSDAGEAVYSTAVAWADQAVTQASLDNIIPETLSQRFMASEGDMNLLGVDEIHGLRPVLDILTSRLYGVYHIPESTDDDLVVDVSHHTGVFAITLRKNRRLRFINGSQDLDYRRLLLEVTQDSTGGWTLTPDPASTSFGIDDPGIVLSVEPGAVDVLGWMYTFATNKCRLLAASHGYE